MARQHALVSMLALAMASCGGGDEAAERGPREQGPSPIIPYEVELTENRRQVQAVGTARAKAAATVRPETAGVVEEVLFTAGQFAEKGDPLLALEADEERLAVNLARVSVREAEQLLERYRRIEDTGAVSDSAIDEARTQLEAAKINLEQAELALSERTVRAPFDGYVGLTDIDPGARVSQDTDITTIDDRRTLYVDFSVPEDVFSQLAVGDRVEMIPFAEGDRPRSAEITYLDSRIDPQSRAFRVRASLDNTDDRLRPGMSFDVRFSIPGRSYPSVPEAAIVWGSDGAYLWAVRDDKAVRVPVQIVSRMEGRVLVDGALRDGSVIVAEGVQKVREGSAVTFLAQRSSALAPGAREALD